MRILSIVVILVLSGCGALTTLEDRSEAALEAGVNPEEREFHYFREGNTIHYFRRECTGKFCKKDE